MEGNDDNLSKKHTELSPSSNKQVALNKFVPINNLRIILLIGVEESKGHQEVVRP